MKKKKTPYLDFYKKCMETGYMPIPDGAFDANGLCTSLRHFGSTKNFDLITPSYEEEMELKANGYCDAYWGYGLKNHENVRVYELCTKFTPLRQTIVLFMAAMNNEL